MADNDNTKLPMAIGNAVLYHESDVVTLESQLGFTVECNLKFDICSLELSGKKKVITGLRLRFDCALCRMVFRKNCRTLGYNE